MIETLLYASLLFVLYAYVGYPFCLFVLCRIMRRPVETGAVQMPVSVVIAARNEQYTIVKRVLNLLNQQYPADLLQIVVVSDGSTDSTVQMLKDMQVPNLDIVVLEQSVGKAAALNAGVSRAIGDLLLFTDCRQSFAPDALRLLVQNFADPSVGCVSGELVFLQDETSAIQAEMGAYWSYEKWIRKAESATGSVVGATGAIYAVRRALYRPLPQGTLLDDVLTPLNVVLQGYRCVFDNRAVAYDIVSKSAGQEWKRKVRTLAGNWQLLSLFPSLAVPVANPLWWRFISHKISRLLVPFALVVLLVSSFVTQHFFAVVLLVGQVLFYSAAASCLFPACRNNRVAKLAYFFVVMNCAALVGFWWWVSGRCASAWQPAYLPAGAPR